MASLVSTVSQKVVSGVGAGGYAVTESHKWDSVSVTNAQMVSQASHRGLDGQVGVLCGAGEYFGIGGNILGPWAGWCGRPDICARPAGPADPKNKKKSHDPQG